MTHVEDENALKNRSYIFNMASCDWLRQYEKKGNIDPRAWLFLDTDHWEKLLTMTQLSIRENVLRQLYNNDILTPETDTQIITDKEQQPSKVSKLEFPDIEDDDHEQIIAVASDYDNLNTPQQQWYQHAMG